MTDELLGLMEPYVYGHGFQDPVRPPNPSAGANLTHKLDSRWDSRLLVARWTLVTGAAAANRTMTIQIQDADGNVLAEEGAGLVVTANTTQVFNANAWRTSAEWAANTPVYQPLPRLISEGGWALVLAVGNIQAADQLSGISLLFERFPSGGSGYPEGMLSNDRRGVLGGG